MNDRILILGGGLPIEAAGEVIGGIGLTIDRKYAHGELAYSLAREHWGKGLVVEAAREVVR